MNIDGEDVGEDEVKKSQDRLLTLQVRVIFASLCLLTLDAVSLLLLFHDAQTSRAVLIMWSNGRLPRLAPLAVVALPVSELHRCRANREFRGGGTRGGGQGEREGTEE